MQADGPALRLHRLLRRAGQERRRLRADPRGAVRARRRARLPRPPAPDRSRERGHAVVVVAEGAGQESCADEPAPTDASGNVRLGDIGGSCSSGSPTHFAAHGLELNLKYIDPSYAIRSVPANPYDSVYCVRLAHAAVHAAMAGRTEMVVGRWHGRFVHVPIPVGDQPPQQVDPDGDLWMSVLESTGQPARFARPAGRAGGGVAGRYGTAGQHQHRPLAVRSARRGRPPWRRRDGRSRSARRTRRPARGSRCARSGSAPGRRSSPATCSTIAIACAAPIVGPSPTGTSSRSTCPSAASCASRSAAWPRSPRCATRIPPKEKTKSVFGPRCVPATSSCSDAMPTTSPTGDSWVPASARSTTGSPPIAPTPLWSRCSWVTSRRSALTPSIARVVPAQPAAAYRGQVVERVDEDRRAAVGQAERRLAVPLKLHAAPSGRGRRPGTRPPRMADAAAAIRHATIAKANAACRPSRNGAEIRVGKNDRPGQHGLAVRRQRAEHVRVDEVLDRVVAEERREQDRHGRQLAHRVRRRGRDAVALEAGRERVRERRRQADDHQREEDADRQDLRRVLERLVHRAAGAAVLRRQARHDRGAVRRGEHPHRDPDQREDRAEREVGEVRRQQQEQPEADRGQEHPGGRERARAEAVGQVAGGRPREQHPDRQGKHVDAGPQRGLGEVEAVLRAARRPAARSRA